MHHPIAWLVRTTAKLAVTVLPSGMCMAQASDNESVATLYRSSVAIDGARFHIATFDAADRTSNETTFDYNWSNCTIAASLFESQPGVKVDYWCEKGFFRQ